MEAPDLRRDELIRSIERAFDAVSREDGVSLNEAEVIDAYGSEAERRAARSHDLEPSWQELPEAEIKRHCDILPFLDPKGWRYYLPAYMT